MKITLEGLPASDGVHWTLEWESVNPDEVCSAVAVVLRTLQDNVEERAGVNTLALLLESVFSHYSKLSEPPPVLEVVE